MSTKPGQLHFYKYLGQSLEKYIHAPFRENVSEDFSYRRTPHGSWLVRDKVSYICRTSEGSIQPTISWGVDEPSEFLSVKSLTMQVEYPFNHDRRGQTETIFPFDGKNISDYPSYTVEISLDKFITIDRLIVVIKSEYEVSAERFETWVMAHPTRILDFSVRFPKAYEIQIEPILLDRDIMKRGEPEPGYAKVEYDSWVLPGSGLAWRLVPKAETVERGQGNVTVDSDQPERAADA